MSRFQLLYHGDWEAVVDTECGANCIRLRNRKHEAYLLREPAEYPLDYPYLYGMPILFPVNRIEGGCFEFEGRLYSFPINEPKTNCHLHGTLHQTPFQITRQTKRLIQCTFKAEKGEYLGFPHAFEVIQEYELQSDGLCHRVTVKNNSDENMPVFLGFHTTFNTLFTEESRVENISVHMPLIEEYERNMAKNYLPTGKILMLDEVSEALKNGSFRPSDADISRHYRGEGSMSITDEARGLRVIYQPDEKFGFRLIYGSAKEGYLCMEPQTCLANCQNAPFPRNKSGFDYIQPKKSKSYCSKIYLEEIK